MERFYMLSKYAHLKGTALSNSLIPQPPNKKFFALCAKSFCSGVAFKTQYASDFKWAIFATSSTMFSDYQLNLAVFMTTL